MSGKGKDNDTHETSGLPNRGLHHPADDGLSIDILLVMILLLLAVFIFPVPHATQDPKLGVTGDQVSLSSLSTRAKTSDSQLRRRPSLWKSSADKINNMVDRQMQDAAKKSELTSERTALDNQRWAPQINDNEIPAFHSGPLNQNDDYLHEQPEDRFSKVYEDVSDPKSPDYRGNPVTRIDSIMERRRFLNEYQRKQREEYVRQVIENAKKDGYNISINNQLEVVSVRPGSKDSPLHLNSRTFESISSGDPDPFDPNNSGSH